jgi:4-hydroxybenzoate polyprenyltransferase
VLWAYNHPTRGLRGRPPGDLLSQAGYLLVVPLSAVLNAQPLPSWGVMVYLALFCAQAQLIGEVMDIAPDRAAGRRTTATALGARWSKWIIIVVVIGEIAMLAGPLDDPVFAGGMAGFLGWLLLDQLVLFRDGQYTLAQMKLFGVGGNLCALASMAWVWVRGGLGS